MAQAMPALSMIRTVSNHHIASPVPGIWSACNGFAKLVMKVNHKGCESDKLKSRQAPCPSVE